MKQETHDEAEMAYEASYFAEQKLILIRVWGTVSLEENHDIGERLNAILQGVEDKADVLFDLRKLERFPTSMGDLRQTSAVIRSPKLGWIVLLTNNILLKFVATILVQLQTGSKRFYVYDTLENGLHFLETSQPPSPERKTWLANLGKRLGS